MRIRILALFMVSMFLLLSASAASLTDDTRQDAEAGPEFTFDRYNSYAGVRAELQRISAEYPDITSFSVLGQTWEGRDIMAMRLTDNPYLDEDEPAVLIMGGHHGNELASVEVPMYVLGFLTDNYHGNETVKELVDSRDIWFVPLVNPDGREHALAEMAAGANPPAWRKNRRPIDTNGDGTFDGTGVDINRNYGHLWGELPGTSHDPMAINYCGPAAFSEAETAAIRDLAFSMNFTVSVSYHTYGQVIYYPWNNNKDTVSPKAELLEAMGRDLGELTGYTPMNGVDAYPTTGDSDDWLYANTDCLPFTIELGTQYVTPPEQLESLCARNLGAALCAMEMAEEPERALLPEWTFMVYMSSDADPELANEAFNDLNEMEAAGSNDDLDIIVLYDGRATGDSKIYHIQKDTGTFDGNIISPTIDDQGAVINATTMELDMSDPAVLRNFVAWTRDNYPAKKYILVLWGHGDGVISGFVPDKGKSMKVGDIRGALDGFSIDIVGFDTCSMGHLEVATELIGIADIMIGSEAKEPMAGWDYETSLGNLEQFPRMGPRELAITIVGDFLSANTENYVTQAALDLAVLEDRLFPALGDFVNASLDFAHTDHRKIWMARNASATFVPAQDAVDLFEFLENLEAGNASGPVLRRLGSILEMRDELIIHSGAGSLHPDARAMAVYFPMLGDSLSGAYAGLNFLETGWRGYLAGTKSPAPRPFITHSEPWAADNTTGPFFINATLSGSGPGPFSLLYRPVPGQWQSAPMSLDGQNLTAEIPEQSVAAAIEYYFLDAGSNITEPYEVKWGGRVYFTLNITINTSAECDISLTWAELPSRGRLRPGDILTLRLNCSNAGPGQALANISLEAIGASGSKTIGWQAIELGPGEYRILEFSWIAEAGTWELEAKATLESAVDTDPTNQSLSLQANVSGGFLEEYGMIILVLATLWAATALLMVRILRKARRRRRSAAARSLANARQFLAMAGELGGDTAPAARTLDRAEAALADGAIPVCERLIREARESAMDAVGEGLNGT